MAKLTKSRTKKPLAERDLVLCYSHGSKQIELSLMVDESDSKPTWFSLTMSQAEFDRVALFVAKYKDAL